ncbi:MAG TPA: glycosyltransferase family 2 protein, partial [Firmicutes bacterium]|nr:glycosyltransferase family 2 protein [Bacillota bacterium]
MGERRGATPRRVRETPVLNGLSVVICSVVIPTYNRPDQIAAALDALAAQYESDAPFAVIVVDDGSEPALSISNRDRPFPVNLVRLTENRGRAAARNAGISAVDTPLTVFLDDDIRVEPGYMRAVQNRIDPEGSEIGIG